MSFEQGPQTNPDGQEPFVTQSYDAADDTIPMESAANTIPSEVVEATPLHEPGEQQEGSFDKNENTQKFIQAFEAWGREPFTHDGTEYSFGQIKQEGDTLFIEASTVMGGALGSSIKLPFAFKNPDGIFELIDNEAVKFEFMDFAL